MVGEYSLYSVTHFERNKRNLEVDTDFRGFPSGFPSNKKSFIPWKPDFRNFLLKKKLIKLQTDFFSFSHSEKENLISVSRVHNTQGIQEILGGCQQFKNLMLLQMLWGGP